MKSMGNTIFRGLTFHIIVYKSAMLAMLPYL